MQAGTVKGMVARLLARSLVGDLEDDTIWWNADRAITNLDLLWPDSQQALKSALESGDRQTRMFAASVLRDRCAGEASDTLLSLSIEDLRDDSTIRAYPWNAMNARQAAGFLCQYPDRIEQLLRVALKSDDSQQRLLAAAIAGYAGVGALVDEAAPVLILQLKDDDIPGNAKLAAPALYRFGPAVIPHLEAHLDSDDSQLRAIVRSIVERIRYPRRRLDQLENPMPRLTEVTVDPLKNLNITDAFSDVR